MTILVVALLNGRTKEQWYDWIEDRVKNGYGYNTPSEVPQIYAPSRLNAFQARQQAYAERRQRENERDHDSYGSAFGGFGMRQGQGPLGLARTLLGSGISFNPATGIMSDDGTLMFGGDDSDEGEDSGEEDMDMDHEHGGLPAFLSSAGTRPDVTRSLKAQLEELEDSGGRSRFEQLSDDEDSEGNHFKDSDDEDQVMSEPDDEAQQAFGAYKQKPEAPSTNGPVFDGSHGEAPPPPARLPNGIPKVTQLNSLPGGDEAPPVVKAEGLLDGSESPLKG